MASVETYYAVVNDDEGIPAQYEWYQELDSATTDVIESAEDANDTFLVYEITIRPVYRTKITVELEKI